jgi:hypothetical protein
VTISEHDNTVCYVVEVPQSDTAHMARDHRYYTCGKQERFTMKAKIQYLFRSSALLPRHVVLSVAEVAA